MKEERKFAISFDEGETYYGDYDTIKEAVKDAPEMALDLGLECMDKDSTIMIGVSERAFRIDGESVDSEDIIETLEENANCGEEGFFDDDPFLMNQWEYDELNAEIARTMVKFLHNKFPNEIDEDGKVIRFRAIQRASMFDWEGHFLYEGPYNKGELQLPKGWKVGDPEPDFI